MTSVEYEKAMWQREEAEKDLHAAHEQVNMLREKVEESAWRLEVLQRENKRGVEGYFKRREAKRQLEDDEHQFMSLTWQFEEAQQRYQEADDRVRQIVLNSS